MKTLLIAVGLPRSGKSTWASGRGSPVVNPDSIRLAIHGQAFVAQAEPLVWPIALMMVRSLFISGHNEVIVDATNTTKERRKLWKSKEWETQCVIFGIGMETCIERAKSTQREDLIPVIECMNAAYEPVQEDEGLVIASNDKLFTLS